MAQGSLARRLPRSVIDPRRAQGHASAGSDVAPSFGCHRPPPSPVSCAAIDQEKTAFVIREAR